MLLMSSGAGEVLSVKRPESLNNILALKPAAQRTAGSPCPDKHQNAKALRVLPCILNMLQNGAGQLVQVGIRLLLEHPQLLLHLCKHNSTCVVPSHTNYEEF